MNMKSKAIPSKGKTIPTIGTKIDGNSNVFIKCKVLLLIFALLLKYSNYSRFLLK